MSMRGLTTAITVAALATFTLHARTSLAQPLGPNGSRIQTNDYAIDLVQGPVLASTRVIGLAGAYVAIAEFTEGNSQNPAAPAVRSPYSFHHIDYDIGFGLTFPSTLRDSDFFNTGKRETSLPETEEEGFVFLELAGNLQYGGWGVGLVSGLAQYSLGRGSNGDDGEELEAQIVTTDIQVARQFLEGQVIGGIGLRLATLSIVNQRAGAAEAELFSTTGAAPEIGVLLRPNDEPFRIGAAYRAKVRTTVDEATTLTNIVYRGTPDELYLPGSVALPWELSVGAAYQFGKPFNPRWYDPAKLVQNVERYVRWRARDRERRRQILHQRAERAGGDVQAAKAAIDAELASEAAVDRASLERAEIVTRQRLVERYREMQRFYVLLSTALVMRGPVTGAVGVESFLEREVNRSGTETTLSPRLGVETEVIPNWLTLRGGSYLEPTRFASNPEGSRLHGTAGLDVRLVEWSIFGLWPDEYTWRLRGAVDGARDYFGWGVAIGGWY